MDSSQETGPEATAAGTGYTMTKADPIVLAGKVFGVEIQDYNTTGGRMVWLTGARGATYFLREYSNRNGLFQVIAWNSGRELRDRYSKPVAVVMLGDVIEVAAQ